MTRNEAANTVFNGAFIGFVILIGVVGVNAFATWAIAYGTVAGREPSQFHSLGPTGDHQLSQGSAR